MSTFNKGVSGIARTMMGMMAVNMMAEGLIARKPIQPTNCPWFYGPPMKETWRQRERRLRARADRRR